MHVTIEYMILIPVLILQMFLFPIVVSGMMDNWVDSRQTLALQEIASHIGSSIQQVYFSLNHTSILDGTLTNQLGIPPFVEGLPYSGNATLRGILDPLESNKILDITLTLQGTTVSVFTSVTLGQNVDWRDTILSSNSLQDGNQCCITAQKSNGAILLFFGNT
jgi:hypothetical protein